jgi:hypothetical protein
MTRTQAVIAAAALATGLTAASFLAIAWILRHGIDHLGAKS